MDDVPPPPPPGPPPLLKKNSPETARQRARTEPRKTNGKPRRRLLRLTAREVALLPPMPDRLPPFVLQEHEVHDDLHQHLDKDWTLDPNRERELKNREIRNDMIKEALLKGQRISYRSSGWSLYPTVNPNDRRTYEPVSGEDDVWSGDVVFCQVQPGDRYYAHVVLDKYFDRWYDKNVFIQAAKTVGAT